MGLTMESCTLSTLLYVMGSVNMISSMPMPEMPAGSPMNMTQSMGYLSDYGYLGESNPMKKYRDMARDDMGQAVSMALTLFQERYQYYGLTPSGQFDMKTLNLMAQPRCGNQDLVSVGDMMKRKRKRRYNLFGTKWPNTDVTYRISAYPQDNDLSPREVDFEIMRAFKVWEAASPLTFIKKRRDEKVDIDIRFVESYNDHGDNNPFDGPSGTLAHAFFPTSADIGGDSHFDEAEVWTVDSNEGINLFQVAVHEFGHALGLKHSEVPEALMAPFYAGYIPDFVLPNDDTRGIQAIYGRPNRVVSTTTTTTTTTTSTTPRPTPRQTAMPRTTTTTPKPTTTTTPIVNVVPVDPRHGKMKNVCSDPKFDAISTILTRSGEYKTYAFQGDQYFQTTYGVGVARSYPRLIKEGWPGLEDNVDAALFWDAVYETNMIFNQTTMEYMTTKRQTIPPATFIFKGSQYWRVEDMEVVDDFPRQISEWGLPNNIDAAFVWKPNGKTYFIKGSEYWRYTENDGIDSGYPKSIGVWTVNSTTEIDAVIQGPDGKTTLWFSGSQFHIFNDSNYSFEGTKDIEPYWLNCYSNSINVNANVTFVLVFAIISSLKGLLD